MSPLKTTSTNRKAHKFEIEKEVADLRDYNQPGRTEQPHNWTRRPPIFPISGPAETKIKREEGVSDEEVKHVSDAPERKEQWRKRRDLERKEAAQERERVRWLLLVEDFQACLEREEARSWEGLGEREQWAEELQLPFDPFGEMEWEAGMVL